ncbi:MAG: TolC family protein [Syntrophobacteraceae bacterium]|nr:TolC family protein [Syntrophobacteraceae bacterium]
MRLTHYGGKGRWIGLSLLCMLMLAAGEPLASERPVLTLDQVIRMALDYSPQIQEAEQDVKAAETDLAQAKAGQWAQMDVTAYGGPVQDADTPLVVVSPAKGPDGLLRGDIKNRDETSIGIFGRLELSIVQPLYTFGKISQRQKAASHGLEAQRAAREKKRGEVILTAKEYYFGYIVAKQGIDAADDADAFLQDARRRITRLLEVNSTHVEESDLYRLDAFEAEIQRFKIKAETGAKMAYLALKKHIGYPPTKDFQLDMKVLPKDTRALGTQEECVQKAMSQRPEFEQIRRGIEARQALVEAAKADLYPSVFAAAVGSFAGAPGRERLANSYIEDDFNHAYMGAILGANWHFDLGIGQARVRKARAELQKMLHTKEYAEQNIPLEVAKYYQDSIEAQASFQAYEKAAVASRKWVVSAFSNFDMGVGPARDIFDAIDRYGKNQGEYLLSLYNYHVSLARLSYAVGEYRSQQY